jgi:16S rRNA (guanine966-N2)-methyltransferase
MNARTPKKQTPTRRNSASGATQPNRLRIIGGRWRGVPIKFPAIADIRPSPDRVRETLFNWLQQPIVGARCLDLFAGSGALGIEALSRGAAHVTFVDAEPQIATHIKQTLERLNVQDQTIVTMDAVKFLKGPAQPFDVIFLDPPYASDLLERACAQIANGWAASNAWVYLESAADRLLPPLPAGWLMHRSKRAGQVGYHLAQAIS